MLRAARRGWQPDDARADRAGEVAGYEAELAALEQLRRESAERCTKESCKTSQRQFDRAARLFNTDIKLLLAKGKKKPPSKSPLARGRRGG